MDILTQKLQRAALATIDRSSVEIRRGVSALENVCTVDYHPKWGDNVCWVVDRLKGQARDGVESMGLAGAAPGQSDQANAKLVEITDACSLVKDSTAIPSPPSKIASVIKNISPVKTACLELSDGLAHFAQNIRNKDVDTSSHRARHIDKPSLTPGARGLPT